MMPFRSNAPAPYPLPDASEPRTSGIRTVTGLVSGSRVRYELVEVLACGCKGTVHLGGELRDEQLSRLVAIKRGHPQLDGAEDSAVACSTKRGSPRSCRTPTPYACSTFTTTRRARR
jgi:hypothetical protein